MTDMYWAGKYKSKIENLLVYSDEIIKLINPIDDDRFDIQDVLLGGTFEIDGEQVILQGHIFDYFYIPSTVVQSKVFICIETEVNEVYEDLITEFTLNVNVFTEKSNVMMSENSIPSKTEMAKLKYAGNRIDMLCQSIEKLLRGNSSFGIGNIRRARNRYSTISAPSNEYYGRTMRYTVKNYTEDEGDDCGD